MIKKSTFIKAVSEFDRLEKRTYFFGLSNNLIKKGFKIEAYILLLATWNFARFRYAVKQFDIDEFKKTLNDLRKDFKVLQNKRIETIDLFQYSSNIATIFNTLSNIKGVEYAGAPKLMHLTNPKLFIMWDGYIRGTKTKKYYDKLDIVKSKEWIHKKYKSTAEDYLNFLKDMQCYFNHLKSPSNKKTLAKAIDEFNYVKITLPIQEMEKEEKINKKKRKK